MRIFMFLHDAFGGFGGIGKFNRDFLNGLCAHPRVEAVMALPRLAPEPVGTLPPKLAYPLDGLGGQLRYGRAALRRILGGGRLDLVVCGHLRLLPVAWLAHRFKRAPLVLVIHGIDAWTPPESRLLRLLVRRVDAVLAVSDYTKRRFLAWAGLPADKVLLLPNGVELRHLSPGPKDPALIARYGLAGKTALLTLGRLVSKERAKGMDEVIEALPDLLRERPDLVYLIAGDGPDRPRLEAKARGLGLAGKVVFCGRVSEAEKQAHYRLADAYIMPSRGEGFGIVLLEAMACGLPTVASAKDGGREAVRGGLLGGLVDPDDPASVKAGIRAALARPKGVPEGLDYFSAAAFERRLHAILDRLEPGA